MISTIHLEYTADMKHMKVTGIDNETVFKHTFYDPVNKVKTNIVFDGTVALCEKVSDYESDMTKCENTSTTCVKKFTQESILTHSDISTFIAWVREYNIQSEFLCDQGLVSGLRFTYKYAESGESSTQRCVTDAEKLAWNAKWDYDEDVIKSVKVDNATNADTVGGKTVAADVPADAKFTDTIYSHPLSHPASMITESTTRRFVSDAEKTLWDTKSEFSGNYNDLSNKPIIPSTTSQLTNNSGYITINDIPEAPPSIQVGGVKPTDGSMWYEVI